MAEEIRTGLDEDERTVFSPACAKPDILDELYFWKPVRGHVREFSFVLCIIGLCFAGLAVYKGHFTRGLLFAGTGLILAGLGCRAPLLLHPLWKVFIKLGHKLGLMMTYAILLLCWLLMLLPIAMIMRIVRKQVLDLSYGSTRETYWEQRDGSHDNFRLLERQF